MSKLNPLAGLIGNYGDSDDESDEGSHPMTVASDGRSNDAATHHASAAIHPAPIPHCPWSACYDETSGFTYYWNQVTNAVTWEAPPEYLLALKLAQQQLHTAGSTEVSAEEWQLYQQALAEKQNSQNKMTAKTTISKTAKKNPTPNKDKNNRFSKKRIYNEDDDEKIELITSYHNSDSESNDEADSPVKPVATKCVAPPLPKIPMSKPTPPKKPKTKPHVEYRTPLPPKQQNYTFPIGPELPPQLVENAPISPKPKVHNDVAVKVDKKPTKQNDNEDNQDETTLFLKLKDKARLLEKLGGEIPKELKKMIEDGTKSGNSTPKTNETKIFSDSIDDLLEEIEKKELPKVHKTKNIDVIESDTKIKDLACTKLSPKSDRGDTPPLEAKPLFPSIKNIEDTKPPSPKQTSPKVIDIEDEKKPEVLEKKVNLYLTDANEPLEKVNRKKLRISNSVLPERKKNEEPAYTTKYSQFIEGFSSERTGLGFSKQEDGVESPKNTINYGNGLLFTKGETLNEDKKDEDLDELTELVEAKLNYLNQLQPCQVTPVQEMLIQMQTLVSAFRAGALTHAHWRRWALGAARSLRAHEARAAPPGWTCAFQRSEGRYCYRREADGLVQWEYPAVANTDMDISTTPPHPGIEGKDEPPPPPQSLPPPPPPAASPPAPVVPAVPAAPAVPAVPTVPVVPAPATAAGSPAVRMRTPPPPAWFDPPPPGCDDLPPLPPPQPKQEIGDELASFYSDIAELEKRSPGPHTGSDSPELKEHKEVHREPIKTGVDKEREKEKDKTTKKKSKVKISSSMGIKHRSVSNLVAKWQQVADEINSD